MLSCFLLCSCGDKSVDKRSNSPTTLNQKTTEQQIVQLSMEYPYYDTADDLVESCDLAVVGRVINTEDVILDLLGTDDEGNVIERTPMPYTVYTIEISKIYKGSYAESTIKVRQMGGVMDNIKYVTAEDVSIDNDREYLFMLSTYDYVVGEEVYPTLVNVTQSYFNLTGTSISSESNLKARNFTVPVMDGISLTDVVESFNK